MALNKIASNIMLFLTLLFGIYIVDSNSNFIFAKAQEVLQTDIDNFIHKTDDYVDYLFTANEVNSSKITDTSISITSDNFNRNFLDNAKTISSMHGYDVTYNDGEITVSGLIPDFLYGSLYIEAEAQNGEKYTMLIKDFKTSKSPDPIKQFISQTLQYTFKRSILPSDFYMWEHKILTREVTLQEFILRILQDPQILYSNDSPSKYIEKMYSAIFLTQISNDELNNWIEKFENYKSTYYLKNEEAYNLIAENMFASEDFKTRISSLNMEEIEIPLNTRYQEVYENSKVSSREVYKHETLYVMNYEELNKSKMGDNCVKLFLNENFEGSLNYNTKFSVNVKNITAKYSNGKIVLEGLAPNTVYKNIVITYYEKGVEKLILIPAVKTICSDQDNLSKINLVEGEFDILNHFNISQEDFLKQFYKDQYNMEVTDDKLNYFKVLFILNGREIEKDFNVGIKEEVLIQKIYDFIFGRFPDEEGLKFWTQEFKNNTAFLSREKAVEQIIIEIMESDEFKIRFDDVILEKIIFLNNQRKKLHIV